MGAVGHAGAKRGLNALNNYMYYGDYEEGEFFAEDLCFKDEKMKDSPVTKRSPTDRPAPLDPSEIASTASSSNVRASGAAKYQRRPYKR